VLLATSTLLLSGFAWSQEPVRQEIERVRERVIVTADRAEQTTLEVGSSVTVLTADDLRARGVHWLSDALAAVPGVTIARSGGPGAITSVFLRGTNSNHALVLLDGIKANSPTTGGFDFSGFPVSAVERVEIVRGPQSVLYGSEAIGGVINIITRRGGGPTRAAASVDGGSFGTWRATANLEGGTGTTRYAASLEHFDADGFSAADGERGNPEADGFRNTTATGRLAVGGPQGFGAEAQVMYFDGRVAIDGYDFAAGPVDDPDRLQDRRELLAAGAVTYRRGIYSGRLGASISDGELAGINPNGFNTRSRLDTAIREVDFQNDFTLDENNTSTAGIEYRRESGTASATSAFGESGFDEEISTTGIYALHRVTLADQVNVSGGIRFTDHSTFGGRTTFRLTAAWLAGNGLRAHGSIGSGFRAPSLNDLYYPGFSNPDLRPEESRGWDLGIGAALAGDRVDIDVTWYRNDIDDLIQYVFPVGIVNVGQARTQGLEVAAGWAITPVVRVDASYTFTDATDRDTGAALLRRPRHQAWGALQWRAAQDLLLLAEMRHKGTRSDFGTAGVEELPAYTLLNAAAQVGLGSGVTVIGRLDNLTDRRHQDVWGYGTAGFSGYAGLRYEWGAK
jgi:vitamin B12 transporter